MQDGKSIRRRGVKIENETPFSTIHEGSPLTHNLVLGEPHEIRLLKRFIFYSLPLLSYLSLPGLDFNF